MKPSTAVLLAALCLPALLRAHEGHDHAPVPGETDAGLGGPIVLSEPTRRNLGLQTHEAELAEIRPALTVPARLTVVPERNARITGAVDGRVTRLDVKLGQNVKRGQVLAEILPLAIGTRPLELTAPLDGVVLRINAAPGQGFKPEDVLLEVADLSSLLAEGLLSQTPELLKFELGQPGRVVLDAGPAVEGRIDRIDPSANAETNTLRAYVLVPNPDGKLRVNLTGKLVLSYGEAQMATIIPARAVLGDLGRSFVFVETEPGTYERREVVTGIRAGERIEIIDGVVPGEVVVTLGNYQLQFIPPAKKAAEPVKSAPAPAPAK